jgi:hypothetical protein
VSDPEEVVVDGELVSTDLSEEPPPVSAEVAVRDNPSAVNLFGAKTPVQVIESATQVANALKDVLRQQGMIQNIQGRDHVRVEGWQTTGAMLGLAAKVVWARPISDPVTKQPIPVQYEVVEFNRKTQVERRFTVDGYDWEARVEVVKGDGTVIAAAEGMCSRKESTWAKRDDFSLRSMAQTRATSKALRGVLGFIVTMAGYEATPSEEMPVAPEPLPGGVGASDALSQTFNTALGWAEVNGVLPIGQGQKLRLALIESAGGYLPSSAASAVVTLIKSIKDEYESRLADEAAERDANEAAEAAESEGEK